MLSKTMGLNALGELSNSLLGFGMMIDVEVLKCESQYSNSKHTSAILMIFLKHIESLTMILRCLQDSLLEPRVDELLHFMIELINSASGNRSHDEGHLFETSFSKLKSIRWS